MKRLVIILVMILIAVPTQAVIIREDHLFNQGIGARPLAMGNAFTAIGNDLNSVFYNPAGIASIKEFDLLGLSSKRLIASNLIFGSELLWEKSKNLKYKFTPLGGLFNLKL